MPKIWHILQNGWLFLYCIYDLILVEYWEWKALKRIMKNNGNVFYFHVNIFQVSTKTSFLFCIIVLGTIITNITIRPDYVIGTIGVMRDYYFLKGQHVKPKSHSYTYYAWKYCYERDTVYSEYSNQPNSVQCFFYLLHLGVLIVMTLARSVLLVESPLMTIVVSTCMLFISLVLYTRFCDHKYCSEACREDAIEYMNSRRYY